MTDELVLYAWQSNFAKFNATPAKVIRERLSAFVTDASKEHHRVWVD